MTRTFIVVAFMGLGFSISCRRPSSDYVRPDPSIEIRRVLEVRRRLNSATSVELLALDPTPPPGTDLPHVLPGAPAISGWPITGVVHLSNPTEIKAVVQAISSGIVPREGISLCFYPHHGARVSTPDGVVEVVICYSCWQVDVSPGGTFRVTPSGEAVLNEVLDAHHVAHFVTTRATGEPPNPSLQRTRYARR